jgi:hypothetical protein
VAHLESSERRESDFITLLQRRRDLVDDQVDYFRRLAFREFGLAGNGIYDFGFRQVLKSPYAALVR